MNDRPANRLALETSPYLLQHAHNPVDWYPWGEEAFEKARREDKPLFLSIGYSACHWCHVMERESFENDEVAEILNREFVSIKVDREERPDVDSIYMKAVQMMTGHGGWPMSMFLTPEGVPFFGGTYYPPEDSRGMPGFKRVLTHLASAWRNHRNQVDESTKEILEALSASAPRSSRGEEISQSVLAEIAQQSVHNFDPVNGGFGGSPKFPPSMTLEFLMSVAARTGDETLRNVIETTLRKMAGGGIYDQVGGGFHRYSTDARWLAPHFEKMLYDNALLARLYVHAWQWTKDPLYSRIANETLGFVLREMTSPDGGFYSTLDADSEGEEGKFYVWQRSEVLGALGPEEGRVFCAWFDVSDRGNWESTNILNTPRELDAVAGDLGIPAERLAEIIARGKCHLYGVRETRPRPGRDEKILAGWNGWMLAAFAEAALAFGRREYLDAVRRNADFLVDTMIDGDRLYRSFKDGRRRIPGLLEDYAGVAWGLIAAFEATQEPRYLETARRLASAITSRFTDRENGGFFDTPDDHEKLITRPKDLFDNATPAGNSVAVDVLNRMALYFGDPELERTAGDALDSAWAMAKRYPSGFGFLLTAAEWRAGKPKEIVITGPAEDSRTDALRRVVGEEYLPHRILASAAVPDLPVMEGRPADRVAAWVCEGYVCLEPADDPEGLRNILQS